MFRFLLTPSGGKVALTAQDLALYANRPKPTSRECSRPWPRARPASWGPTGARRHARQDREIFHDALAAPILGPAPRVGRRGVDTAGSGSACGRARLALDGPRNLSVERETRGQDRRDERDDRNDDRSAHDQRDISWTARKSRLARRVRGGYVVSIALMQSTTRRAPRGGARSGAARERADVSNCSAAGNFAPPASVARPSTTGG